MYTTTMTVLQPEAHIAVKKSRLKLYENRNYYLKDKTTFEIELFNPTSQKVLAKIWLNDKLISASGIVLRPHERVYLERFIDNPNKFVFNTFEVDDVKETADAREKNGLVKVSFFSENSGSGWITTTSSPTVLYGNGTTFTTTSNPYTITGNISTNYINTSATNAASYITSAETGRVGEGTKSEQDLRSVDEKFSDFSFIGYEFQILPESLKTVYAGDIRQYCHECGTRIRKSSWKFCPNCGEKL